MLFRLILLICLILNLNYGAEVANVGSHVSEHGSDESVNLKASAPDELQKESINLEASTLDEPQDESINARASAPHRSRIVSEKHACTTADGKVGSCLLVPACKKLDDLLKHDIKKPGVLEFLRKSQCGDRNSLTIRYVCCPITSSSSQPIVTTSVPATSSIPAAGTSNRGRGTNRKTNSSPGITANPLSNARECGNRSVSAVKVIGGQESELGSWPWMAALYCTNSSGQRYFQCGGSLISNEWVLTASHCLKCRDSSKLSSVRLGDLDLRESVNDEATPVDRQIKQIIQHPEYVTSPMQNDIALLRLSQPVAFSTNIYPICLFSGEEYNSDEYYFRKEPSPYVAGYGTNQFGDGSLKRLFEAQVPMVNLTQCENNYVNLKGKATIDGRVLCAGDGTRDSCSGDSGGPLMFYDLRKKRFYQGGIVSFGVKCAEKDFPGVYTKVASFMEWIKKTTGLAF